MKVGRNFLEKGHWMRHGCITNYNQIKRGAFGERQKFRGPPTCHNCILFQFKYKLKMSFDFMYKMSTTDSVVKTVYCCRLNCQAFLVVTTMLILVDTKQQNGCPRLCDLLKNTQLKYKSTKTGE